MRKSIIRGISYCIALVMMVALVFGIIGTSNLTASAVGAPITSEIKIAHITDLHYFPFEDCNVKDPNDKKSDFYIKLATDTKLCQEAGTILNAVYKKIVAENPDYLVVSGDITRDSELQAHIDVANGLRYLQNTIRETNPDFQIFVVPGNHDLVNTNASKFDANGSRAKDADGNVISGEKLATSVSEFPKIYAGLGYPNLTAENRAEYIAKYVSHSASFGLTTSYIESSNLPNIVFHRYSDIIGYPTADDKAVNCLTYVAIIDNAKVAVCGIDSTERKAAENIFGWEHETGGRITQNCLNWLSAKTAASREANYTLIGTLHHNVAPHYAMEENLTKDFTLYNWEDTATYLADEVGLRYVFTGHMHASDRAQFTSYKGNTITDFETGSTVSLKAPSRYVTISRTEYDNKVYEDVTSLVIPIESLENIQSFHIDKPTTFEVHPEYFAFQQVTNLTDMIEKGLYDLLIRRLVDGFVNEGLQSMLYDLVDGVIPPSLSLAGLKLELPQTALMKVVNIVLDDLFNNLTYVYDGKSYDNLISVAHALVNGVLNIVVYTDGEEAYTLEQVGIKMYKEHLIGGEAADYAALDAKFKGLSERLLTTDLKQNTIKQLADILLNTLIMNKDSLIPVLLSHKFDISGLTYDASITDPAAASKRFTAKEQADITKLFNVLRDLAGIDILDKGYICLNEIVELPLVQSLLSKLIDTKGMPLLDFVYDALGKYLTTSFYTGLGGIVNNIVMAFSIDDTFDGHTADISKTNFHELYTYRVDNGLNMGITVNGVKFGTAYDGEPHFTTATYADGRLPSHATATFGDKTNTSVNLSFYTNHEVNGLVKYRVKGSTAEWSTINSSVELKPVAFPLMDLGLFATYTSTSLDKKGTIPATFANREEVKGSVKFANIHSVTLSNLLPNTEYEYQLVGTFEDKVYPTKTKYFKTALSEGSTNEFTVLAMTDVQAMLKSDYQNALEAFEKIEVAYDFIINCGDVVDSGKNTTQWSYSQNILSTVWGETLTVVAAGNHEDSDFALDNYYNFGNAPSQKTETGVYYSFNYGNAHFTVINTNDSTAKEGLGKAQLEWLVADLASAKNNPNIKWIVVSQHKGLYSAGSHSYDSEVIALRGQLSSIYYDYGVDLVLQGHDHVYNTTEFLDRLGKPVNVRETDGTVFAPKGVMYVTLGTIGNKYYEYRKNHIVTDVCNDTLTYSDMLSQPTYATLTFANDKLTISNYMVGNEKFNKSISISKTAIVEETDVKLDKITFGGAIVSDGANILATKDTLLNALNIARFDFGSNCLITVNNVTAQENIYKALHNGANTISIKLLPENGDEAGAKVISFGVYILNYELTVNGKTYNVGDTITVPSKTKSIDIKYLADENNENAETIIVENNKLKKGDNTVVVKVTSKNADGTISTDYTYSINVYVEKGNSNIPLILGAVGGVILVGGVVLAIVMVKRKDKSLDNGDKTDKNSDDNAA